QDHVQAVADGMGGVIVVWEDARGDTVSDIYAQRLTAEGTTAWANGGGRGCAAPGDHRAPGGGDDGHGGAGVAGLEGRARGGGRAGRCSGVLRGWGCARRPGRRISWRW